MKPHGLDLSATVSRVRLLARHALGEALHWRLAWLLALIGAALVVAARGLQDFNFGATELKFIGDFGLGAMGLFGTVLAALAMAQLFFHDLQTRAAYCVLTRPVRRWEYVVGKFCGTAGLLALFVGGLGALLAAVLAWRAAQLGATGFAFEVFVAACALQWLKLTLVAAMTLLVCSYASSSLFASCVGLLFTVIGHLRDFASAGLLSGLRVWPDFGLYDAEGLLAAGSLPGLAWLFALGVHWLAYVGLFVGVAALVFKHREL